jgi:uncharacterized protein GlcG (DUF336 family)
MKSLMLLTVLGTTLLAQAPVAPPPTIPYGISISPDLAKKVAAAAVAEAAKNKWAMAVAVVDTGGHLVYFERMTDTQVGSIEIAIEKAKTSAEFRRPTSVFQEAIAKGGDNLRFLRMTGVIPVDGGFPLIVDGKLIGAVGASGGSSAEDGRTGQAGANALK